MKKDMMLDIETMGNKSNSVILSIGAVMFDIETGETGDEFYERIEFQSALDVGLKVNADTIEWWMMQSDAARQALFAKPRFEIKKVLGDFSGFCRKHEAINSHLGGVEIWGNGARFDIGLLEDAYDACGFNNPWKFWNERDVRTIVAEAPQIKDSIRFSGIPHDPIDDAKHQIKYLVATKKFIRNGQTNTSIH